MNSYDAVLPWSVIAQRVARLARPERSYQAATIAIGILLSVASGLSLTLGLVLVYRVLGASTDFGSEGIADRLMRALDGESLWLIASVTIVLTVGGAVLSEVSRVFSEIIANRVTHRARADIYAAYLESTYQEASGRGHGAVLDILDYEAPFLTASVIHATHIVTSVTMVAAYAAYLLFLSPYMGLVILLLGIALAATLSLASRRLSHLGSRISSLNERLLAHTVATVEGMRTIRLHSAEHGFIRRYREASGAVSEAHIRLARSHAATSGLRQIGKLLTLAVLVWAAARLHVPAASVVLVLAVLFRVVPLVTDLEERVLSLFNGQLPLSIVCNALTPPELSQPASGTRPFTGFRQDLTFRDVSFAHNFETPVLSGASFTIPAGKLVTLVGPSGGGKTTLINLLARLYEPQGGEISVDGVSLAEFDRASWLARLGFSGQDIDLQEGSILENIRFYNDAISEADAWWALDVAHAADFVRAHQMGVHARVGDRGLRLSGGQRQRIGLARAIARRPDLLILDEATNAVDIALETRIYEAIRAALPNATILVITHRSSIALAAAQFALRDGQVTALELPPQPVEAV